MLFWQSLIGQDAPAPCRRARPLNAEGRRARQEGRQVLFFSSLALGCATRKGGWTTSLFTTDLGASPEWVIEQFSWR